MLYVKEYREPMSQKVFPKRAIRHMAIALILLTGCLIKKMEGAQVLSEPPPLLFSVFYPLLKRTAQLILRLQQVLCRLIVAGSKRVLDQGDNLILAVQIVDIWACRI